VTDEEIILLGDFCEQLMRDERFTVIVQQYDLQCWTHTSTTLEHETKKREVLYFKRAGVQEFLDHLKAIIDQKNALSETTRIEDVD